MMLFPRVQAPTLCVHPGCEYSRKSSMKKWQNCNFPFSAECGGTPAGGESAVHKLMDAMSSAQKLPGAGLTPHFQAERSSNGSCGGPPPVRSSPGRWKNPRQQLMSHFHSVLQSVPLGRSVHGPVAVEPIASCRFQCLSPLFCTALRRLISRAVEAAMLYFLSSSQFKADFMCVCVARISRLFWETLLLTMIRRFNRHRFGWMRSWYCTSLGKRLQGRRRGSFILWSQCSGILSVRSCPVSWANIPEGDRLTAAEELFRDSGSVQMSCSSLSRSAEFCSAFPQCLHVAPRVSIPWDRSLLFPQRVTSFTLDRMKKLKNDPIVGDIGFCRQRVRPFLAQVVWNA